MSGLTICLWYDDEAEEAARFYVQAFRDAGKPAELGPTMRQGVDTPVLTAEFTLDGQRFVGLNGGPAFKPTMAHSLMVECRDQAQIDHFWSRLSQGGETSQCGWLIDRWGYAWQILPAEMMAMVRDPDRGRGERVFRAMQGMTKLDIAALRAARDAG
ncbi:VOC family protein [Falsiroseomonas tokyonensis]|uniref:VOC family protein n=1 Tax=Falsiroseomonas tokyonensis TaxID=430521 RepID=A0ABV7BTK4_9PROT|nr:VOC family protein [Falsiroseomonas tokyonensis]MBU8537815.1 VOC family protein [Falsiroseomonas tokyonensis]